MIFHKVFFIGFISGLVASIKNRYPLLLELFFCRFRCVEWSKVIVKDEIIVSKIILNVWNEEMFYDILIDDSINQFFQEVDLSNTGGRYANPNHYQLR